MGGQKQEVKSLEAGDIPYVEVTKIRPKVYWLASKSTLRHCNNEGQKRNSRDKLFLFFFQNYLRDTGINFEFVCSPAHTQTFKKKRERLEN